MFRQTYNIMKKRLRKFGEEIIPLSTRQSFILLLLIACIFQFLLFFTPALAAEAMVTESDAPINLGTVIISDSMEVNAQKVANEIVTNQTVPTVISEPQDAVEVVDEPVVIPDKVIRTSVHTMTAYNSEVGQTDNSPCITANGFNVCKHGQEDTIAANFLKFGTKVKIPDLYGNRIFVVRDRMNKKHPNRVDIWMKDRTSALKFGVKTAKIQVIE